MLGKIPRKPGKNILRSATRRPPPQLTGAPSPRLPRRVPAWGSVAGLAVKISLHFALRDFERVSRSFAAPTPLVSPAGLLGTGAAHPPTPLPRPYSKGIFYLAGAGGGYYSIISFQRWETFVSPFVNPPKCCPLSQRCALPALPKGEPSKATLVSPGGRASFAKPTPLPPSRKFTER